jgi:hypothetical protein
MFNQFKKNISNNKIATLVMIIGCYELVNQKTLTGVLVILLGMFLFDTYEQR